MAVMHCHMILDRIVPTQNKVASVHRGLFIHNVIIIIERYQKHQIIVASDDSKSLKASSK